MSLVTDNLLLSLNSLLASGKEIPATDLRAFETQMIGAIAILEARARGNRIFYTSGRPGDVLGLEGDLGVNKDNGDFYAFAGGTFNFLFNGAGKAGLFTPIAANAFGTHPGFTNQDELNKWLLGNLGAGTGTPTPAKPTVASFSPTSAAVDASVTITGTNFGATAGTVKFNGILANVLSWNPTAIVAKVPTGGATGSITLTTAGGLMTSASGFTVVTTPEGQLAIPTGLSATATSISTIELSWNAVPNAPAGTTYQLERAASSSSSGGTTVSYLGSATSDTDNQLNPSTTYYYRLKAVAAPGSGYTDSLYSSVVSATTLANSDPNYLAPQQQHFWYNQTYASSQFAGVMRVDPNAALAVSTNAPSFIIRVAGNIQDADVGPDLNGKSPAAQHGFTAYYENRRLQDGAYPATNDGTTTDIVVSSLPGSGTRTFWLNTPSVARGARPANGPEDMFFFANIVAVIIPDGYTGSLLSAPAKQADSLFILADSTGSHMKVRNPFIQAGAPQMRRKLGSGCDVASEGFGGRRLLEVNAAAVASKADAWLSGRGGEKVCLTKLSINDVLNASSTGVTAQQIGAAMVRLQQALVGKFTRQYVMLPPLAGANDNVPLFLAARQEITTQMASALPAVPVLDGSLAYMSQDTALPDTYGSGDQLHPWGEGVAFETAWLARNLFPAKFAAPAYLDGIKQNLRLAGSKAVLDGEFTLIIRALLPTSLNDGQQHRWVSQFSSHTDPYGDGRIMLRSAGKSYTWGALPPGAANQDGTGGGFVDEGYLGHCVMIVLRVGKGAGLVRMGVNYHLTPSLQQLDGTGVQDLTLGARRLLDNTRDQFAALAYENTILAARAYTDDEINEIVDLGGEILPTSPLYTDPALRIYAPDGRTNQANSNYAIALETT